MKINFLFDNSKLLKLLWGVGNTYPRRFEAGGSRFYKNPGFISKSSNRGITVPDPNAGLIASQLHSFRISRSTSLKRLYLGPFGRDLQARGPEKVKSKIIFIYFHSHKLLVETSWSRPTHPVGVAQGEGFFQTKPPLPKENLKLARSGMQVGPSSWESVHLQPVRAKKTQFTF